MRTRFFTLLLLCSGALLRAQDLHFSQFYLHPLHYNPAQTGAMPGDLRAAALYRSQWTTVPVSYRTEAGAVDVKLLRRGANALSAGLLLQHDKAGDAGLTWTQIGLTGAVAHVLDEQNTLSAGFGLSIVQRSFDIAGLTFKNQWTGDLFDPAQPTKETFDRSSGLSPTVSAGLTWLFAVPRTRTLVNAGAGAAHLNRPRINFRDDAEIRLPTRLAFTVNSAVQLNEFLDLVVFGLVQRMGKAQEIIGGAGAKLWLIPNDAALQFALSTRLGDALIPALQYQRGNWTVGLSYDWNISGFEVATAHRGGFEIGVVYQSIPAPPVKTFKSCPIF